MGPEHGPIRLVTRSKEASRKHAGSPARSPGDPRTAAPIRCSDGSPIRFTRSVRDRALALFSPDPEVSMSRAKVFLSGPDYSIDDPETGARLVKGGFEPMLWPRRGARSEDELTGMLKGCIAA